MLVEVPVDHDAGVRLAPQHGCDKCKHRLHSVPVRRIIDWLYVDAEEVQRYVLVGNAGPAQRGPDGLNSFEFNAIENDQGSSVSL